ncbi:hypothetical protein [Nocardioides nitrophenolicus]|uniref:hypothetical protein n=1 Tax=Nocardioides nitrophenolicus TaxID=60489 RepID=UPI0019589372|nr:hypothetical protein [Nocardioides nitrophenolicus]MBM7518643.1 hypothetical protein [Nocardioides nitrophenolicus]
MSFPTAVEPDKVGTYPATAHAGGGYVWDEVLEYRVWCHPDQGADDTSDGDDYFYAFSTYEDALAHSEATIGAEPPLALVRQREYIDETGDGAFRHVERERITEWPVPFLSRPRRDDRTIPEFLAPDAPENKLAILRGEAPRPQTG